MAGGDLLGWVVTPKMWTRLPAALTTVAKNYGNLGGLNALVLTFLFLLLVTTWCAWALGAPVKKFVLGFTLVFFLTYLCVIAGNHAHIAANKPSEMKDFGIGWSLRLTGEALGPVLLRQSMPLRVVGVFHGN